MHSLGYPAQRELLAGGEEVAPLRHSVKLHAKSDRALRRERLIGDYTDSIRQLLIGEVRNRLLCLPRRFVIAIGRDAILAPGLIVFQRYDREQARTAGAITFRIEDDIRAAPVLAQLHPHPFDRQRSFARGGQVELPRATVPRGTCLSLFGWKTSSSM